MGQSISFMVEETTEETTIGETTKETTTIGETTVQETTIVETTKTATKGELETKVLGEKMDRTTPGENEEQPLTAHLSTRTSTARRQRSHQRH